MMTDAERLLFELTEKKLVSVNLPIGALQIISKHLAAEREECAKVVESMGVAAPQGLIRATVAAGHIRSRS